MDPFETELHRTIATLEEMLASYRERIPSVYLNSFNKSVYTRIGRAKSHLLLLGNTE